MIRERYNFSTGSTEKAQNFPSVSKTPNQPMLQKLDLNWNSKLEKLLNNTDDQDDYFQVYSDASNTTIPTICLNSNDSRYTDSCWSGTDATRSEDIVIELPEWYFYNAKVNPFPHLNFPATSPSKKSVSTVIEDVQNIVAPTHGELMIDVRTSDDIDPDAIGNADVQNNHTMTPINEVVNVENCEDSPAAADGVGSEVRVGHNYEDMVATTEMNDYPSSKLLVCDVSNDLANDQNLVAATNEVVIVVDDDQCNKVLTLDVSCDLPAIHQSNEDSPAADRVRSEVVHDDINQDLGYSANKNAFNDQNNEVVPSDSTDNQNINEILPIADATNVAEEPQNHGDPAAANIYKNPDVSATQNITIPEVVKFESTNLIRKRSTSSRNSGNESSTILVRKKTSSKNNSTVDNRKKRYTKTTDTNHRNNVERHLSKTSDCTQVTSTTTVHVTTNDDAIFDALADMPEFINFSVIDLASSYIENRIRQEKNQRSSFIDFETVVPSSSSSLTPSWRNEKLSSIYDEYISSREAYKQLQALLTDGTRENLRAVMYDEYNCIRCEDDVASSEDEFLSDVDDLNLSNTNWTPPESELRRQVGIIVKKIHPLENHYNTVVDDILNKYLNYIHSKMRIARVNRIVDCVNKPVSQQEKTELLIRREMDDKKLNREFYHSPMEPPEFTEFGERRRAAIVRKYTRCHNDRKFCYSYFKRSIDDRPVSQLGRRIAKLKREMELIFA